MRIRHRAEIRLEIPSGEAIVVHMRDFSESGLYVCCNRENLVSIGDLVFLKTLEFDDAPIQQVKVVRVDAGEGFAAEFVLS